MIEASDGDRAGWDDYVNSNTDAEPYHEYAWRNIFEQVLKASCCYLQAVDEDGRIRGVLPLVQLKSRLFGNFLVSVPWFNYCGTLADDADVRDELVRAAWEAARAIGASHVELRHRASTRLDLPYRDDKVAMQLALPASADELWAAFKPKLRAQIRRPGKEGAIVECGGVELLDDFYAIFARNMRDLGTPVFPKDLFLAMLDTFPDATRIFVVRLGGEACAAGVTYGFRETLEIPSASTLREFNRYSVNMLLYWSVLKFAIKQGFRVFDFGRSTRDSGTYRFKRQWGAEPQDLHWHYCLPPGQVPPKLNPDNPKFRLATRIWRRLPVSVANLLGPAIVRNLP
ncbi:MAG: FemAB family PEP-CTERM system-associated protein [Woeseiaceae bacterium]|nr:FemAB family PEP-CTERM system-associated protein [Woeseiaceae bacterium]